MSLAEKLSSEVPPVENKRDRFVGGKNDGTWKVGSIRDQPALVKLIDAISEGKCPMLSRG